MTHSTLQRILYVEDEPDIRQVAKLSLEKVGGFTVELCASGDEAIKSISSFGPDLILLDVMMPGMDGPTTLKKLRELPQSEHIPAIFMTAKAQPQEIEEFKQIGALDVIPKPFDPMTLAQSVREIWSARYGNAMPPQAPRQTTKPRPAADGIADPIAEITRQFVESIPERIGEVVSLFRAMSSGAASAEERQTLYRKVHSLNGSAKMFGMAPMSEAARALELQLKPIAAHADPPSARELSKLNALVDALLMCAGQQPAAAASAPLPVWPAQPAELPLGEAGRLIYIFADGAEWAGVVRDQLQGCGYEVCTFGAAAELLTA